MSAPRSMLALLCLIGAVNAGWRSAGVTHMDTNFKLSFAADMGGDRAESSSSDSTTGTTLRLKVESVGTKHVFSDVIGESDMQGCDGWTPEQVHSLLVDAVNPDVADAELEIGFFHRLLVDGKVQCHRTSSSLRDTDEPSSWMETAFEPTSDAKQGVVVMLRRADKFQPRHFYMFLGYESHNPVDRHERILTELQRNVQSLKRDTSTLGTQLLHNIKAELAKLQHHYSSTVKEDIVQLEKRFTTFRQWTLIGGATMAIVVLMLLSAIITLHTRIGSLRTRGAASPGRSRSKSPVRQSTNAKPADRVDDDDDEVLLSPRSRSPAPFRPRRGVARSPRRRR